MDDLKVQSDYSDEELDQIDLQLKILTYSTLDFFDDKQKIKGASRAPNVAQEHTYLGLIMETFLEYFSLDIYGYISNTNYKYIIIKNEQKTSASGQKPSDTPIKNVLDLSLTL